MERTFFVSSRSNYQSRWIIKSIVLAALLTITAASLTSAAVTITNKNDVDGKTFAVGDEITVIWEGNVLVGWMSPNAGQTWYCVTFQQGCSLYDQDPNYWQSEEDPVSGPTRFTAETSYSGFAGSNRDGVTSFNALNKDIIFMLSDYPETGFRDATQPGYANADQFVFRISDGTVSVHELRINQKTSSPVMNITTDANLFNLLGRNISTNIIQVHSGINNTGSGTYILKISDQKRLLMPVLSR